MTPAPDFSISHNDEGLTTSHFAYPNKPFCFCVARTYHTRFLFSSFFHRRLTCLPPPPQNPPRNCITVSSSLPSLSICLSPGKRKSPLPSSLSPFRPGKRNLPSLCLSTPGKGNPLSSSKVYKNRRKIGVKGRGTADTGWGRDRSFIHGWRGGKCARENGRGLGEGSKKKNKRKRG